MRENGLWQPGCLEETRGFPSLPRGRFGLSFKKCRSLQKGLDHKAMRVGLRPLKGATQRYVQNAAGLFILATRLSSGDPWLSVPASRQVWL